MCADSHEWRGELQRERGGALGAEPLSPPARHHLLPLPARAQHPVGIYITYHILCIHGENDGCMGPRNGSSTDEGIHINIHIIGWLKPLYARVYASRLPLTLTHILMSISREGPSVSERLLSRKLLFRSFWERNSVGSQRMPLPL